MHITHGLLQITHDLLPGTTQPKDSRPTDRSSCKHILVARDDSGHDVELTALTRRLELQDDAFKFDMPEAGTLAILTMYDMAVVDEISFLDEP